jgi:2,3-bisphosphoglycerate-independent phosphoglycerate mutase
MELRDLVNDNPCHIVLLVMDGLGGYADDQFDSELEQARTPNLDRLAAEGATGLAIPVGPGITPGSGPGHLALFGYDPFEFELGRGVLSAVGLGFVPLVCDARKQVKKHHTKHVMDVDERVGNDADISVCSLTTVRQVRPHLVPVAPGV